MIRPSTNYLFAFPDLNWIRAKNFDQQRVRRPDKMSKIVSEKYVKNVQGKSCFLKINKYVMFFWDELNFDHFGYNVFFNIDQQNSDQVSKTLDLKKQDKTI